MRSGAGRFISAAYLDRKCTTQDASTHSLSLLLCKTKRIDLGNIVTWQPPCCNRAERCTPCGGGGKRES